MITSHVQFVGCGNSAMSLQLYKSGRNRITNIDYSDNVISKMKIKHLSCVDMQWITMDILNMEFASNAFNVVMCGEKVLSK